MGEIVSFQEAFRQVLPREGKREKGKGKREKGHPLKVTSQ